MNTTLTPKSQELLSPATRIVELRNGEGMTLVNGLQPYKTEVIEYEGQLHRVNVAATISGRDADDTVLVGVDYTQSNERPVGSCLVRLSGEVNANGTPIAKNLVSSEKYPIGGRIAIDSGGYVSIHKASEEEPDKTVFEVKNRKYDSRSIKIEISEAGNPKVPTNWREQDRYERRMYYIRKAMAVLAVLSVTGTGGLRDRILDRSHEAGEYVENLLGEDPRVHNRFDSTRLSQQEIQPAERAEIVNRVANLMDALDTHNTEYIENEANKFETRYSEEIFSQEEIDELKGKIDKADSDEEVTEVLQNFFLNQFSITFERRDGSIRDLNIYKEWARACIDAFGPLPISFIRESTDFRSMVIGDTREEIQEETGGAGTVMASMGRGRLTVYGQDLDFGIVSVGFGNSKARTLLHELIHSVNLDTDNLVYSFGMTDGGVAPYSDQKYGWKNVPLSFLSRFFGSPLHTSLYASVASGSEEEAETGADVLRGHFAHPDHVGQFESRANDRRIAMAVALEAKYPGLIAYLIFRNPGLVEIG